MSVIGGAAEISSETNRRLAIHASRPSRLVNVKQALRQTSNSVCSRIAVLVCKLNTTDGRMTSNNASNETMNWTDDTTVFSLQKIAAIHQQSRQNLQNAGKDGKHSRHRDVLSLQQRCRRCFMQTRCGDGFS
jgi:hypothetical protein